MRSTPLIVLFVVLSSAIYCQHYPSLKNQFIKHSYYALSFNTAYNQADWVYYELDPSMFKGKVKRHNVFKADPLLENSPEPYDYKYSGYQRGHLCPAADMSFSREAMDETFYMTNMSPQEPGFNTGIWKRIEEFERSCASREHIYVVTGGVLKQGLATIGENKVSVPEQFYKVIADLDEPVLRGMAFLVNNEKNNEEILQFAVPIDSVETITGIDFFSDLPAEKQNEIESTVNFLTLPDEAPAVVPVKENKPFSGRESGQSKEASTRQRNMIILLLVFAILALVIITIAYVIYRRKNRR